VPRGVGRRGLAIGGLAAGAIAAGVIVTGGDHDGGAAAQEAGVPTVSLERRELTSRESVDGTLGYAGEATVINRLSGTFTWLPAEGDVIRRGQRLFEVDGEPVILMYGDVPAYRDLSDGVSGPDVEELESNLSALGFDPGTVDEDFTSSTASAVADWQDSLDLDVTGTVELGRVVFMAGPRRVTSLSVSLGSSGDSSAGGSDPSAAADAPSDQLPSATTSLASYVTGNAGANQPSKPKKPRKKPQGSKRPSGSSGQSNTSDTAQPAGDSSGSADTGSGEDAATSAPSTELMTTSSERRIVTVDLDPSDGELVKRGTAARIDLPDGKDVKGRVSSIGTVAADDSSDSAAASGDGSSDPTIEVTIALPDGSHVTALDQAPVTVDITDEVRRNVFAVPVESLLGTAGGGYAIEVDDSAGRRQIPVEPGLFADGYVEVRGNGLREGMRVEVPGE
jgi:peptidoglycan hydrolase-like protein with peptidoglycan-binding domain